MLELLLAALTLVVCCFSSPASAQSADPVGDSSGYLAPGRASTAAAGVTAEPQRREEFAPSVKPVRHWYGGAVLISDLVSLTLVGTGIGLTFSDDPAASNATAPLILAGAIGYELVPPTIHLLHERPGMIAASSGLRVLVPPITALLGATGMDCGRTQRCDLSLPVFGLFAGAALVSIIDACVLSYDRPVLERQPVARLGFAPFLSQDGKQAEVRAFGTF